MARYCRLLNTFEVFFCKIGGPHVFNHSGMKVVEGFSIISKVTTQITINYPRVNFFSSESLNWNNVSSVHLELKITFSSRYGKSISAVCLTLVHKSSESLPK